MAKKRCPAYRRQVALRPDGGFVRHGPGRVSLFCPGGSQPVVDCPGCGKKVGAVYPSRVNPAAHKLDDGSWCSRSAPIGR